MLEERLPSNRAELAIGSAALLRRSFAPLLLLALGIAALAGVVNATRPARGRHGVWVSWPAAWFTVELAPQLVALSTLAGAALVALGALATPAGWAGLLALLVADAVAIPKIVQARRTVVELDQDGSELEVESADVPYPRRHLLLPFLAWRRRDVRRADGVEYARAGRARLKLDAYLPTTEVDEPRPAVVQVHGGAWMMGSRREQGVPLLGHLAANGWVGFNVDYRLSPRATFPDHVVDVKRAIAWVREHADEYEVDPSFVAITGGSAGGHLSALAALTAGDRSLQPGFEDADTSVAACVPFYGVYDLLDEDSVHLPLLHELLERYVFKASRDDNAERLRQASPLHRVHADAPPFLVVHGEHDSLVPIEDARRFVERLREVSSAPVEFAQMQGGQHAFDVIPSWRTIPAIEAIERFLAGVRVRAVREGVPVRGRGGKISASVS